MAPTPLENLWFFCSAFFLKMFLVRNRLPPSLVATGDPPLLNCHLLSEKRDSELSSLLILLKNPLKSFFQLNY